MAMGEVPLTLMPGKVEMVKQSMVVAPARLWSCEAPNLYRMVTEVSVDGETHRPGRDCIRYPQHHF